MRRIRSRKSGRHSPDIFALRRAVQCCALIEKLEERYFLTTVSLTQSTMEVTASNHTPIVYTVSRDNSSGSLLVDYRISGEVTNTDFTSPIYTLQGGQELGSVIIPNGATSIAITAIPVNDPSSTINKTLTVVLLTPDSCGYTLGTTSQGTVRIDESNANNSLDLSVGAGKTYATLNAAAAAFVSGDTIDLFPSANGGGMYIDDNIDISGLNNLTFRGIGPGRTTIFNDSSYQIYNDKGLIAVEPGCTNFIFENLAFEGGFADPSSNNGAGLRFQGTNYTVTNCYFYDDQDGILCGSGSGTVTDNGSATITYSEFSDCGLDGDNPGEQHSLYIGWGTQTLTFEYNYVHNGGGQGHLLKSRALVSYVEYNRLIGQASESYELSFPYGGQAYVIGNIIRQSPNSGNPAIIDYASEVGNPLDPSYADNAGDFLYLVNNTVVNDKSNGIFVQQVATSAPNTKIYAYNNLFAGPGTEFHMAGGANTTLTQSHNVTCSTSAANFVNEAAYDYHLTTGAPAIAAGMNPGTATNGYSLTPLMEPNAITAAVPRASKSPLDAGAFAYPASTTTTLTSSTSAGTFGLAITFTATVAPSDGTNVTGTVQFQVNGTNSGSAVTLSNDIATYTLSTLTTGSDSVAAVYSGDSNNSISTSNTVTETISKAISTLTWSTPAAITYGTGLSSSQLDAGSGGVAGSFIYTPTTGTVLHGGTQTLSVTFTPTDTTDYTTASASVSLQVNRAPLTITANNQSKVYGAALPTLTASYSGFVNGDTSASLTTQPTLATTATAPSHIAGSPYTITASGAVDSDYSISYVAGSLAVTTAPLTITANNKSKVYGAALPTLTASYSGFVNGDTSASLTTGPTLTTTATAASHVAGSPYTITASGAADSDYNISYVAGSLGLTTAPLTITANNQSKVYGAALPTLTASYSGFVNGDTSASLTTQPTLTTTATAASHVAGSPYTITASGAADSDYNISYVAGSLAVTTAPLTITANNQSKVYGAALPTLTASYSGFVNGDTSASLTTQPTLSTTATAASAVVGSPYPITVSSAADSDYNISYANGALTVNTANTTTTVTSSNGSPNYGQAVTFTATVTPTVGVGPTGTVQFKIDGSSVGAPTLIGNTATYSTSALSAGNHSIVAIYNGDSNFATSTSTTFTQNVQPPATPSWASLSNGASATWNSSTQTLTVNSGTVTITADPDPSESAATDPTIIANGSSAHVEVQLADPSGNGDLIHVAGIELLTGATMDVASLGSARRTHNNHEVLVVGTLSASSAPLFSIDSISKMDLEDNDMIVHDGNFDAVQALAFTGRHGTTGGFLDGTWTGDGLTSSAAAHEYAEDDQEFTALAVVSNGDLPLGPYSSWSVGSVSEPLRGDGNDVIVKYTYIGDWTLQGKVGQSAGVVFSGDYGTTPANFDGANSDDSWATGSYNGLSIIGQADGVVFSGYYGSGMSGNANTLGGADANASL